MADHGDPATRQRAGNERHRHGPADWAWLLPPTTARPVPVETRAAPRSLATSIWPAAWAGRRREPPPGPPGSPTHPQAERAADPAGSPAGSATTCQGDHRETGQRDQHHVPRGQPNASVPGAPASTIPSRTWIGPGYTSPGSRFCTDPRFSCASTTGLIARRCDPQAGHRGPAQQQLGSMTRTSAPSATRSAA